MTTIDELTKLAADFEVVARRNESDARRHAALAEWCRGRAGAWQAAAGSVQALLRDLEEQARPVPDGITQDSEGPDVEVPERGTFTLSATPKI